jgi:hypothetical protein
MCNSRCESLRGLEVGLLRAHLKLRAVELWLKAVAIAGRLQLGYWLDLTEALSILVGSAVCIAALRQTQGELVLQYGWTKIGV